MLRGVLVAETQKFWKGTRAGKERRKISGVHANGKFGKVRARVGVKKRKGTSTPEREAGIGTEIALLRKAGRRPCRCEKFSTRKRDVQSRSHGDGSLRMFLHRLTGDWPMKTVAYFCKLPEAPARLSSLEQTSLSVVISTYDKIAERCHLMLILAV